MSETNLEPITFTPSFVNVTLGTGGVTYGLANIDGYRCEFWAGFKLGTGGSVSGAIEMTGPYPLRAAPSGVNLLSCSAAALNASTSFRYGSTGWQQTTAGTQIWVARIAANAQSIGWGHSNKPFNAESDVWAVNDELILHGVVWLNDPNPHL